MKRYQKHWMCRKCKNIQRRKREKQCSWIYMTQHPRRLNLSVIDKLDFRETNSLPFTVQGWGKQEWGLFDTYPLFTVNEKTTTTQKVHASSNPVTLYQASRPQLTFTDNFDTSVTSMPCCLILGGVLASLWKIQPTPCLNSLISTPVIPDTWGGAGGGSSFLERPLATRNMCAAPILWSYQDLQSPNHPISLHCITHLLLSMVSHHILNLLSPCTLSLQTPSPGSV